MNKSAQIKNQHHQRSIKHTHKVHTSLIITQNKIFLEAISDQIRHIVSEYYDI